MKNAVWVLRLRPQATGEAAGQSRSPEAFQIQ